MPSQRKRKHFSTPPPVLADPEKGAHEQLKTPQRSAVLVVLCFCQQKAYLLLKGEQQSINKQFWVHIVD
ncbi:hypothetical protein K469DRAFT_701024 [Zopfia rhizophila CBS 207.26]|uniref:Uncharacterized protein n=1 Tax=Zopfia rhizophila CBS 207.26 TaxID=1314779 RepID=A0A6A6ECP3_9PEZI|nr:hypothetical protein K469DRAFT_701024 [Zopfia rhizophila CBS 207.26]